jgi:hypothetical protein
MKANYRMTGKERRQLVSAIEEITGEKSVYKFMPTCAYEIGDITVDKEGGVSCEDERRIQQLVAALEQKGFTAVDEQEDENTEAEAAPEEETTVEAEVQEPSAEVEEPNTEDAGTPALTISLPLTAANVGTLTNLISAKESLIKKALGITDTRINITEDKIEFPWFDRELTPEETNAYMLFLTQLCKLSKELKHASATPVETDNEKYAFRCFLLRLGFIGPDYKAARKLLLQNLSGSSAFRNGAPAKKENEREEQDAVQDQEVAE